MLISRTGQFIGKRPWAAMIITIVLFALCMIGLSRWKTEFNNAKLWAPSESRAWDDSKRALDWFPEQVREEKILIQAENVLTSAVLLEALELDTKIKVNISIDGKEYNSTCFKTGALCFQDSLLQLWFYNYTVVSALSDQDILNTINAKPVIR